MIGLCLGLTLGGRGGLTPPPGYAFVTSTDSNGNRINITTTDSSGRRVNVATRIAA